MPGSRHKILSHVFSGFSEKMSRTKVLDIGTQAIETPLKRCLTTFDITLLGKYSHILLRITLLKLSTKFQCFLICMTVSYNVYSKKGTRIKRFMRINELTSLVLF